MDGNLLCEPREQPPECKREFRRKRGLHLERSGVEAGS